jgi:predicted metal-dependent hydrolase
MSWFVLRKKRVRRRLRRRTTSAKSKIEFKEHSPLARAIVHERLEHFNQHYNLKYKKVFIRNTRTRWGTCSTLGNLSFNYRIVRLPSALQDYIVVHELCHLAHMNHSAAFWARVAEVMPDWKARRKALQKYRLD